MSRSQLEVAIDISGVTVATNHAKHKMLEEVTGFEIPQSSFLLSRTIGQRFRRKDGHGEEVLLPDHYEKMKRRLFQSTERILNIPPIPGAIEAIKKIAAQHPVRFVTNHQEESTKSYRKWLDLYGFADIPLYASFQSVNRSKFNFTHNAHVIIDDNIANLQPLVGTVAALVLFRGWAENTLDEIEQFRQQDEVHVVQKWGEVLEIIQHVETESETRTHGALLKRALLS